MAEYNFTYWFKENLAYWLQEYFNEREIELKIKTEFHHDVGIVKNKIDIAIFEQNNYNSLIGMEIEFISNRNQILKNYTNFKNWVRYSQNRTGGLMHIIFEPADIYGENVFKLFLGSYADTSKGLNFFYEFFYLDGEIDQREYDKLAKNLVFDNWEFEVRFCSLLIQIFGNEYFTKLKKLSSENTEN